MTFDAIPEELRRRAQWVVWRLEERDGKQTKVPYDACDPKRLASTTDPDTWSAYGYAAKAVERGAADGVGFVFAADDPFCGLDFDDCVHDGAVDPYVQAAVERLGTYAELSPSGDGIHVIARAKVPGTRNRTSDTPWGGKFEVYDHGRFFTMTGRRLDGAPATVNDTDEVDALCGALLPERPTSPPATRGEAVPVSASDAELVELAHSAANGAAFAQLWRGDTSGYASASEADLALCNLLAFWTGGDPARIDSLFRSSGLMRDKWEREDYRERTIALALEGRTEYYDPAPAVVDGSFADRWHEAASGHHVAPPDPDAPPAVHPRIIDMASAIRDSDGPLPWRVKPLAMDSSVTVLVGRPGESKSWLAALMCNAAHNGLELDPFDVYQGVALYLDIENGWRRMGRRFTTAALDADAFIVANGMGIRLPHGAGEIRALVKATGAKLLILDSLRRLAPGMREDKSDDTAPVMAALAELAQDLNIAVVVIHHRSTKREAAAVRGSSAFEDQADLVWVLEKVDGDPERRSRRRLRCIKARDEAEPAPVWVSFKIAAGFMSFGPAESFDASTVEPRAEEVMADRIRALAGQVDMNGGWPPSRLAAAVGSNQQSGTFKKALGIVLAGGWIATGQGKARRIRPPDLPRHEPGQPDSPLRGRTVGPVEDDADEALFKRVEEANAWADEHDITPPRNAQTADTEDEEGR